MNWHDLKEGDFVIPADPTGSPWLVLNVGANEKGEREMLYANLATGSVHVGKTGADVYRKNVMVMRDGENVNK